ncbi:MAG TPA: peptidyl-prolyl cis-trans isomerase [Terriglobales bacterium]|nr:peptidyl-prolyl cis-trans isomerase [Terriglobales bacterium]
MIQRGLVCLLFAGLAWGQATNASPAAKPQPPSAVSAAGTDPMPAADTKPEAPPVAPDTPVITIAGSCDNPSVNKADCKTVVTRAEFEQLVNAIAPTMPASAKKQFASRYATALVMARKAHEMGADQGPKFDEMMKLARMQVAAQQLNQAMQQKASDVPDKDIEDYYNKNLAAYQQVDLERIFIPKTKQQETSKVKLSEAETDKRKKDAEDAMKTEADKLRARAAAGEDFSKLQAEAYTAAGFKTTPPQTKMTKVRRNTLPPTQASVFDMKTGEISPVITDMSGYYIYKVGEKDTLPLSQVHDEILGSLKSQRFQEAMQSVQQSATPTLNDDYFGAGPATPQGALPDGMRRRPKPPTLGPQ